LDTLDSCFCHFWGGIFFPVGFDGGKDDHAENAGSEAVVGEVLEFSALDGTHDEVDGEDARDEGCSGS